MNIPPFSMTWRTASAAIAPNATTLSLRRQWQSSGKSGQIECRLVTAAFVPRRCRSRRSSAVSNPTPPGRRGDSSTGWAAGFGSAVSLAASNNTRPAGWTAKCGATAPFALIIPVPAVAGCRLPPLLPLAVSNNTRPASWAAKYGATAPFAVIVPVAGSHRYLLASWSPAPGPCSRRCLSPIVYRNSVLYVSRFSEMRLTSTGTFQNRACFDQKQQKGGGLRAQKRKKR